jgi:hypothetical protein
MMEVIPLDHIALLTTPPLLPLREKVSAEGRRMRGRAERRFAQA